MSFTIILGALSVVAESQRLRYMLSVFSSVAVNVAARRRHRAALAVVCCRWRHWWRHRWRHGIVQLLQPTASRPWGPLVETRRSRDRAVSANQPLPSQQRHRRLPALRGCWCWHRYPWQRRAGRRPIRARLPRRRRVSARWLVENQGHVPLTVPQNVVLAVFSHSPHRK